jgi:hypothetical protein
MCGMVVCRMVMAGMIAVIVPGMVGMICHASLLPCFLPHQGNR